MTLCTELEEHWATRVDTSGLRSQGHQILEEMVMSFEELSI